MENVLKVWLSHECQMLSGTVRAMILSGPSDEGPYDRALYWPKDDAHDVLSNVARMALHAKQPVVKTCSGKVENTGEPLDSLACPLIVNEQLIGVVAFELTNRSQSMQKATVQQVQIGVKWLASMLDIHQNSFKEQLVHLIDLIATGLDHEKFKVAAIEVCNEIADRFGCYRVSLGFLRRNRIRIEALSHSSRIDQNANLMQAIRDAMSESLDQGATIVYPEISTLASTSNRLHARLSKMQNGASICTLPLLKNNKTVGGLVLERAIDKPFTTEMVENCEQVGLLIGPVLEIRRRDERPLLSKIFESFRIWFLKLLGPRKLLLKATAILTVALLIMLSLVESSYRISCDSVLEAGTCQVIVAPQQGYIADVHVRAGDLVQKGDLLVTLDDNELRLEQRRWQSQRSQLRKEYRKALAGFARADVAILNAKLTQAETKLNLVAQQLARIRLAAPFSGLIVKGDLSQALGSPVSRGDVLYEVAPTDEYRVVLKIDDRDIGFIAHHQRGHLRLTANPDQTIGITIERLTPISTASEGRNYFRVEAVMDRHSDLIRPGMEGIAKIEVGRAKLVWIYFRRVVDWLRLFTWNWMP